MYRARGYHTWYVVPFGNGSIRLKRLAEALESSHAVWEAIRLAKTLPQDQDIVLVGFRYHFLVKRDFPLCLPSACPDAVTRT